MIKTAPAVFAVGNEYQIMVEVEKESLMYVKVGELTFYDESNGVMNSLSPMHRVCVPMHVLDKEKEYTVIIRPIIERKVYFPETEEPQEFNFNFRPIPEKDVRIFHISDAHSWVEQPIAAAKTFGDVDLLILNGDVIDSSGDPSMFSNIYEICSAITNGEIPVVFSRGNHDMRGYYAEKVTDYIPNSNGKTYYSFRCGNLWGLVLDCGEDKDDDHVEYGYMVASHIFRQRQTEYIKSIIENAENEYAAEGVKTKLIICHNPFSIQLAEPFNIEEEIFSEWAKLLKDNVKPDLMICGHLHATDIYPVGCKRDHLGQPCPVVVASLPIWSEKNFVGGGITIKDTEFEVAFTDSLGVTRSKEIVKRQ